VKGVCPGRPHRADRRRQRARAVAGGHARRRVEHHLGTRQHDRLALHAAGL